MFVNVLRLLLTVGIAFALPVSASPARVIVLPLTVNETSIRSLATATEEQLLTELAREGLLSPLGSSDIAALLGVERQRQMLGCAELGDSCAVELGGALGSRWLVAGAISSAGKRLRLDVKVLDSTQGVAVFRDGRTFDRDGLFEVVASLAKDIRALIAGRETPAHSEPARSRWQPWVLAGSGAAVAIAGGVFLGLAAADVGQLRAKVSMTEYSAAMAQLGDANVRGGLGLGRRDWTIRRQPGLLVDMSDAGLTALPVFDSTFANASSFGESVAISDDGRIIVIGAPNMKGLCSGPPAQAFQAPCRSTGPGSGAVLVFER